jgi:hypothetical protein
MLGIPRTTSAVDEPGRTILKGLDFGWPFFPSTAVKSVEWNVTIRLSGATVRLAASSPSA